MHGTKFGHPENGVIPANPIGPIKDGTFGGELYEEGDKRDGQTTNPKCDKGHHDIKESFQSVLQNCLFASIQNSKLINS